MLSVQQVLYRPRNAERSREAILAAATALFAELGYEGASLGEIAAAADLSRGAPSYFFGSKEDLYLTVLDEAFAVRQAATARAFAPVRAWCAGELAHVVAWLAGEAPPDPDGLWAGGDGASGDASADAGVMGS